MLENIHQIAIGYLNQETSYDNGKIGNPFAEPGYEYYMLLIRENHHPSFINKDNLYYISVLYVSPEDYQNRVKYVRYAFKHFPYEAICSIDIGELHDVDKEFCIKQASKCRLHLTDDLVIYGILSCRQYLKYKQEIIGQFNFNVKVDALTHLHSRLLADIKYMNKIPAYLDRMEKVLLMEIPKYTHPETVNVLIILIDTLSHLDEFGYVKVLFQIIQAIKLYGTKDCVTYFIGVLRKEINCV